MLHASNISLFMQKVGKVYTEIYGHPNITRTVPKFISFFMAAALSYALKLDGNNIRIRYVLACLMLDDCLCKEIN